MDWFLELFANWLCCAGYCCGTGCLGLLVVFIDVVCDDCLFIAIVGWFVAFRVVSLGLFCLRYFDVIGVVGICLGLGANAALCGWLLCIVRVWLAGLFDWRCVTCV